MKELRVLVACGGGIATSTFAATEIAKIAKEHKIPVSISKSPLQDVEAIAKDFDICFTTTKFSKEVGTEIVGVNGLITGIGEDETIDLIVEKLKALSVEYYQCNCPVCYGFGWRCVFAIYNLNSWNYLQTETV